MKKMKVMIKRIMPLFFLLVSGVVFAQEEVEMADTMRSNGKIYVLVSMILVILTGILIYLVTIDRKVSKMEKRMPDKP
jgi:CcmD family protein